MRILLGNTVARSVHGEGGEELGRKCLATLLGEFNTQSFLSFPQPFQFRRVLSELEMGGLVNSLEFGILYHNFDMKVGGRNDVN